MFSLQAINTVDVVYSWEWDTTSRISKEVGAGRSSYRYMTRDTAAASPFYGHPKQSDDVESVSKKSRIAVTSSRTPFKT